MINILDELAETINSINDILDILKSNELHSYNVMCVHQEFANLRNNLEKINRYFYSSRED